MVCATTPRLDFVPIVNLARVFLHKASDALEAGRVLEAGVLLREAVRRQLYAECSWKGCLPKDNGKRHSPTALLDALKRAGHVSSIGCECTREIIDLGNRCAHCVHVHPADIRYSITVWHRSIDNDPCGEPTERVEHMKPKTESYDIDDDDDDDDWWKAVGV